MSQLLVKCLCGIQLSTTEDKKGSIMKCPQCNQQFRVPGGPSVQPAQPALTEVDFTSVPAPIVHGPTSSNNRPRQAPVRLNTNAPTYRSSPNYRTQGSSLTSDRALRNTIIGSIIAITLIVVMFAGWIAYERLAPRLAEYAKQSESNATASASEGVDRAVSNRAVSEQADHRPVFEDAVAPISGIRSNSFESNPRESREGTAKMLSNADGRPTASPRFGESSRGPYSNNALPSAGDPLTDNATLDPTGFVAERGSASALSMPDLIEKVEPSIVRVVVQTDGGEGHGSGFVIDDSGLIVTNFHVVEGATAVTVESRDGRTTIPLGFMVAEPERDLCVLKVDPAEFPLRPLAFATQPPSKGESVAAFGSPLGFSFSATNGIVSSNRSGVELQESLNQGGVDGYSILGYTTEMDWVQTTAAISGGNSGGPLVNMRGEMVGVNTFTSTRGQNLNFAVSQQTVTGVVNRRDAIPKPFSELPRATSGSVSGGALAQIFGVETITQAIGSFERSNAGEGELRIFRAYRDAIMDIAVSDDGRYFAVAGAGRKTTVFDQKTGDAMYEIELTEMPIRNVQFVANSKYLTTFRSAGTEPSVVYRNPETGASDGIGIVFPILKLASVMTVSKDGRSVFACWINGTAIVRRYDHFMKSHTSVRITLNDRRTAGAFSDDGQTLMTASSTGNLSVHKLDGETMRTTSNQRDAHQGKVTCVAALPDGNRFVTGGEDGVVCLWKSFVSDNRWRHAKLLGDGADVLCLAVDPEGDRIAVGRSNGKLELFDTKSNRMVHTYDQHESAVTSIEYFPNGKYFLTGTSSGVVRIMQSR